MNPTVVATVSAAVIFVSLLGAIIAGTWPSQRAIERQMESFHNEMRADFASVRAEIESARAEVKSLAERIERVEQHVNALFRSFLPKS